MDGATAPSAHRPLSLLDKSRLGAACAAAAGLFLALGPMVLRGGDGDAALSLLTVRQPAAAFGYSGVLVAVSAVVAAVLAPARLAGVSCFVAAFGLACLNWSGGSIEHLLRYGGGAEPSSRSSLYLRLAMESQCWTVLMVLALFVGRAVNRWIETAGVRSVPPAVRGPVATPGRSLLAAAICAAVAALVVSQFAARSAVSPTEKGQVYFALLTAFYVGTLAATYVFYGVRPIYFVGAVAAVSLLAYLWAWWRPFPNFSGTRYEGMRDVAASALARPLPVEYIALGVIGVLLGCWSAGKIYVLEERQP